MELMTKVLFLPVEETNMNGRCGKSNNDLDYDNVDKTKTKQSWR